MIAAELRGERDQLLSITEALKRDLKKHLDQSKND